MRSCCCLRQSIHHREGDVSPAECLTPHSKVDNASQPNQQSPHNPQYQERNINQPTCNIKNATSTSNCKTCWQQASQLNQPSPHNPPTRNIKNAISTSNSQVDMCWLVHTGSLIMVSCINKPVTSRSLANSTYLVARVQSYFPKDVRVSISANLQSEQ